MHDSKGFSPSPKATVDTAACLAHLQERQRQSDEKREVSRQDAMRMARAAMWSVLPSFHQVHRAYLFGSITRPRAMCNDSDIDIAIEGSLEAADYFALWRELERAIPAWVVDVIELNRDLRFAERVRQTGELIYERPDSYPKG